MARRPDFWKDKDKNKDDAGLRPPHAVSGNFHNDEIMSSDDLRRLRSSLSRLSRSAALQAYHTAYARCRMVNDHVPSACSIQELVQVWKQLWKRR